MKRSEVNHAIREAMRFVKARGLELPPFAYYTVETWKQLPENEREIVDNMLGWDVTDFGSGHFCRTGLVIFTFRNGHFHDTKRYPKQYAEKLLITEEDQELPMHFHWRKMEDIINRGGGHIHMQLFNAADDEGLDDTDVRISVDGKALVVPAGGSLVLKPGQSVTLSPGVYHSWTGVRGTGKVMLFEVSTTNDDTVDNRFLNLADRLPRISEDTAPEFLIFSDYPQYVSFTDPSAIGTDSSALHHNTRR